jgi:hypothetical protein
MTNHKNRLAALEAEQAPAMQKYMVVTDEGKPHAGEPGYKIQPVTRDFRTWPTEEPFYLTTWDEVQAFEARADVDLLHIDICHTDPAGEDK